MRLRASHRTKAVAAVLAAFWLTAADPAPVTLKEAISAYRAGDHATAFKRFLALAKEGDRVAEYNLGTMYLTGRGTEKNLVEAAKWHRMAAEAGLAVAQYGLGVMYYRGDGVPEDLNEAAKWFRRAALQGYADAQFNLGVMYFNGRALPRDMFEVVKWISLAAGQGHADAMYRLGMMYEKGQPFQRDPVEALHWYRRAAAAGHAQALARAQELDREVDAAAQAGIAKANPLAPAPVAPALAVPPAGAPGNGMPTPLLPVEDGAIALPDQPVAEAGQPAPPVAAQPAARAGWSVQLGSFRTAEEADTAWRRLSAHYEAALAGLDESVRRVELDGMGVFHRLQVGPLADGAAAMAVCTALRDKSPHQPCLPVPPDQP